MKFFGQLALFLLLGMFSAEPASPPPRDGNKPGGQHAKPAAKPAGSAVPAAEKTAPPTNAVSKNAEYKEPEYKKAGREGAKPPTPARPAKPK